MEFDRPAIESDLNEVFKLNNSIKLKLDLTISQFIRTLRSSHPKSILMAELPSESRQIIHKINLVKHDILELFKRVKTISQTEDIFYSSPYLDKLDIIYAKDYMKYSIKNCGKIIEILDKLEFILDNHETSTKEALWKTEIYYQKLNKILAQNNVITQYLIKENTTKHMIHEFNNNPDKFRIKQSALKKGDIILSYKTPEFLKNNFISRMICIVQDSPITHSSVVSRKIERKWKMLSSSGFDNSSKEIDIDKKEGEELFVFRPKLKREERRMLEISTDEWTKILAENGNMKFSYKKFWLAIIIGIVYRITNDLARRTIIFKNPFTSENSYFCSELVNQIYLDAGIYLTIKSEYSSTIGPVDISSSPYLNCIGVLDI